MTRRVLLVEDEVDLATPIQHLLRAQGLLCEVAATGREALDAAAANRPDLVLLDLMLPDLSGVEVCRRLRANPATADLLIVMVTARTDEYDKIVGFEAGADDYITKPFSVRELGLRVQSLLRRSGRTRPPEPEPESPPHAPLPVRFGELVLDPSAHRASWNGGRLELTVVEFRMLQTFLDHRGRALTRDEVCLGTWGESYAISERAVDTNVKRLRRKLGEAGRFLETVRGIGYRWSASPDRTGDPEPGELAPPDDPDDDDGAGT